MAFLSALLVAEPTGLWATIIKAFSKIGNYAWAIILLTLCIKVVMLPLDFFNKKVTRKNGAIQAKLQPEMAKIQKQYGHDKNLYNQKLNELYKNNNYNIMGSCVFMLVNLVLTLVIFLTLFSSLGSMGNYKIVNQYDTLKNTYQTAYTESVETTEEGKIADANEAVKFKYNEIKDSWLWIDNVWQPETPWTNSIPSFDEYRSMIGDKFTIEEVIEGVETPVEKAYKDLTEEQQIFFKTEYERVMNPLKESSGRANGYLILAILAIGTALLSQLLTQVRIGKKNKVEGQPAQPTNKLMLIIMPLILGLFTLFYNSVFGLYIIVGQIFSILTAPLIDLIIDKIEAKSEKKKQNTVTVEYSRKK